MQDLEKNKETAVKFLRLAFDEGQPEAAVERYVGADYKQHSPIVGDGKEGFIQFAHEYLADPQSGYVHHRRVFAEDEFVMIHAEEVSKGDEKPLIAIFDLFRLDEDGKLIEHWDILQDVPEKSMNPHPMV